MPTKEQPQPVEDATPKRPKRTGTAYQVYERRELFDAGGDASQAVIGLVPVGEPVHAMNRDLAMDQVVKKNEDLRSRAQSDTPPMLTAGTVKALPAAEPYKLEAETKYRRAR